MLKTNLQNRKLTLGTWMNLSHPSIAEILVQAGYDWVVIDNEHSMLGPEQIQTLISTIQAGGATALVRLSHNNASEIRKTLDAGANGIICPMVNTKQDAENLVNAAKYPPQGQRTYGLYRAQGYAKRSKEYFESANKETIVIAQIEHITAVRNIESILEVPGLDGVFTGPYDLSGSLNVPGQLTHPEVIKAEKEAIAACARKKIACGAHLVHPTAETIQAKLDLGYNFLGVGTDFIFLSEGARIAKAEAEKRMKL